MRRVIESIQKMKKCELKMWMKNVDGEKAELLATYNTTQA